MVSFRPLASVEMVHTSRLKSTPPTGAPNATEIPAAAAAESTSRFRAEAPSEETSDNAAARNTFVAIEIREEFHEQVCETTCNVDQRAFLAHPQPRSNGEALEVVSAHAMMQMAGSANQTEGLDDQSPGAHEVADDEATQDSFDLRNATVFRVDGMVLDQNARTCCEKDLGESANRWRVTSGAAYRKDNEEDVLDDVAARFGGGAKSTAPGMPVRALRQLWALSAKQAGGCNVRLPSYPQQQKFLCR